MPFLNSLKLDGILSFPPGSEAIPLTPLNVLIGPNGSGKSNLIEGIELLRSLPTGFASAIRQGGGVQEWLWKGDPSLDVARIEVEVEQVILGQFLHLPLGKRPAIRYEIEFAPLGPYVEITNEIIQDAFPSSIETEEQRFYYRLEGGISVISAKTVPGSLTQTALGLNGGDLRDQRNLDPKSLKLYESILMQVKDSQAYPELTELGQRFAQIQTFREWNFGPGSEVRQFQRTDMPTEALLPDSRNLGLLLNQLDHSDRWSEFNEYLSRFLPRFQRYSTRVESGTVQFYLHEKGMRLPIPAKRLSDGTIRFIAILAQLLSPTPPPLICMEEPELGLHPDAVALLAELLHEASSRTQLIVTTHSDALVSALTEYADSVLVCEYLGGTVMKRVDSSKLKFWLDKYSLGEIWRIGEIGGNP